MLIATRGKILATKISREKVLESGIVLPEKMKSEKTDNVARVLGVGSPARKDCYLCHDKTRCKPILKHKRCKEHGKIMPITARRTDIIHYKEPYAQKLRYEGQDYIFLTEEAIIAIERGPGQMMETDDPQSIRSNIIAVGSMVIIKLVKQDKIGSIILSDGAKIQEGDFYGEVVSIGPGFPDKSLQIGDKLLYERDNGYRLTGYADRIDYYAVKEKWVGGFEQ